MIRFVFSYGKSAAVFAVMFCLTAAGVTLTCLYTRATLDLVLRLVGLGIFLMVSAVASFAYACKLLAAQIERVGGDECDPAALGARLRTLARRTVGVVRGGILLEYADTQIYRGQYNDAMLSVSDAIVAGKDGVKGEAAIRFCKIFYMLGDREYFVKYYDTALKALERRQSVKRIAPRDGAVADLLAAALGAMRLSLEGKREEALGALPSSPAPALPAMQQKNLNDLRAHIRSSPETV